MFLLKVIELSTFNYTGVAADCKGGVGKHKKYWTNASVYDSILGSTYKIKKNKTKNHG